MKWVWPSRLVDQRRPALPAGNALAERRLAVGAVELGLTSRMKLLAILKQAGFDPGNFRDVTASEPERISNAR